MARSDVAARVRAVAVVDNFPTVRGHMRRNAAAFVKKAAFDIEGNAKANIRAHGLIDTGNLLNSVQAIPGAHELQWFVVVGAHYGIYHEMGTRFLPARPFLLPALEHVAPSLTRAMAGLTA